MGCGGSKEESNPNEIKSEMKETKIADFDDFFKQASEFLEGLEELRAGLQDTRDEMNEIGRTDELATPSLAEAIRVFLWSVSAHKDGDIKAAKLAFESDPPAFTVDCGMMDHKTYDFSAAFKELIATFTGAPQKIIDLGSKAKEIGEKANSMKSELKAKVDGSGLDLLGKGKATANAGINFATVIKGCAKAPEILKQAGEAVNDLKSLLPKIKDLIMGADEVGKKASAAHHKKMDEIFDHYQTAPKKTPEQVKAEHKGKKPKPKRKAKKNAAGGAEHGKAGAEHGKAGAEHGKAEGHGQAEHH